MRNSMRIPWLFLIALGCASTPDQPRAAAPALPPVATVRAGDQQCALVSDRRYFGPSNGRIIFGNFETLEKLAQTLRLDAEVGQYEGRAWLLQDILVSVNFAGNGYGASWIVSAPEPLLTEYVARLQRGYADRSVLYDFTVEPYCISPAFD